jgi:hypothetical protein
MKPAEALSERADLQRQNIIIVRHIGENVRLPEDEGLTEMDGGTLTDALVRRDSLGSWIRAYKGIEGESGCSHTVRSNRQSGSSNGAARL